MEKLNCFNFLKSKVNIPILYKVYIIKGIWIAGFVHRNIQDWRKPSPRKFKRIKQSSQIELRWSQVNKWGEIRSGWNEIEVKQKIQGWDSMTWSMMHPTIQLISCWYEFCPHQVQVYIRSTLMTSPMFGQPGHVQVDLKREKTRKKMTLNDHSGGVSNDLSWRQLTLRSR